MTTSQDTTTRNLEAVVAWATAHGFHHVTEADLLADIGIEEEGVDFWIHPSGCSIVWDAEGNIGLTSDDGFETDDVTAEDFATWTTDAVTTWLVDFAGEA